MLHFPARLSTSVSSDHDLSVAAFITNIAELIFGTHTPDFEPTYPRSGRTNARNATIVLVISVSVRIEPSGFIGGSADH